MKKKSQFEVYPISQLRDRIGYNTQIKLTTKRGNGFFFFGTTSEMLREHKDIDGMLLYQYRREVETEEGFVGIRERNVIEVYPSIIPDDPRMIVVVEGCEQGVFFTDVEYRFRAVEQDGYVRCRRLSCPVYDIAYDKKINKPCNLWKKYKPEDTIGRKSMQCH